jgi:hypothetical protein
VLNPRTQKITTAADTEIVTSGGLTMMTLANTTGAAITVDLYIEADTIARESVNTDLIEATGVLVDLTAGYAVTGALQAIVVKTVAATSDVFLNKAVYKSDGTLFGTCTAFTDANNITFGGGIVAAMADDDNLHVASKSYIIKNVSIPTAVTLKLEGNEINFSRDEFSLWINCSATGIDVITRS